MPPTSSSGFCHSRTRATLDSRRSATPSSNATAPTASDSDEHGGLEAFWGLDPRQSTAMCSTAVYPMSLSSDDKAKQVAFALDAAAQHGLVVFEDETGVASCQTARSSRRPPARCGNLSALNFLPVLMPILQWETAGHSCRRLRVSCSTFSVATTNTSINREGASGLERARPSSCRLTLRLLRRSHQPPHCRCRYRHWPSDDYPTHHHCYRSQHQGPGRPV